MPPSKLHRPVDLRRIVAQAASLTERHGGILRACSASQDPQLLHTHRERWSAKFGGDHTLLEQRWAQAGWSAAAALAYLSPQELAPDAPLPTWAHTLADVMRTAAKTTTTAPSSAATPPTTEPLTASNAASEEQTFADPWLVVARRQLHARCPALALQLSPTAIAGCETALRRRIGGTAEAALSVEQAIAHAHHPGTMLPWQEGDAADPALSDCVADLLADGLATFAITYPVLARRLARIVERWVDALATFLDHWRTDERDLTSVLNTARPLGRIEALELSLGDQHCGGRSVTILTCATAKIVYKPRSCRMEEAWFEFQAWCAQRDPAFEFLPVRVLDRGDHGWMEFVAARDCADLAEVRRHFRSSGGLVGLIYGLGGGDLHFDNIVAHGPYPVVVDAELLLTPGVPSAPSAAETRAVQRAASLWSESVSSTLLLPEWYTTRTGEALNIAGIGGESPGSHNLPRLAGRVMASDDYLEEIVAGFTQAYEFLLTHLPALLATDGPLARWEACPLRFINRSTTLYMTLLEAVARPSHFADGALRSLEFEPLYRALLPSGAGYEPLDHRIIAAEIAALEEGDVPFFQTQAGSRDLPLPDGTVVAKFFAQSGTAHARARLLRLSAADHTRQCAIIRSAFHLARASDTPPPPRCVSSMPLCFQPASDDELRVAVLDIVRTLSDSALRSRGTATWIGPQLIPATDRYRAQPLGYGLYDGLAGVALFLAAATRVTSDPDARALSDEVNATLRAMASDFDRARSWQGTGIGLANGLAGTIYALTHCATLREAPAFSTLAGQMVESLTPESIARDPTHDLLGGCAGAILGLLAHHAATGSKTALARARTAGEHLLQRCGSSPDRRVWRANGHCVTGFSHGAAGYACALLRLHAATGDRAFKALAEEALADETSVFDITQHNWPDLRGLAQPGGGPRFMRTWCGGGPGIALARLATLDLLDTPSIRADIAAGVAVARDEPAGDLDHCCCGNLGRAEILDTAGRGLSDPALRRQARQLAAATLVRARRASGFGCFFGLPRSVQSPGLFQGLSGIGHALLRLLAPEEAPAVLMFSPPAVTPFVTNIPHSPRAICRTPASTALPLLSKQPKLETELFV